MSEWRINFGENLKYLRGVHGLTQVEMAKIVGVCVHTYRKMEHGDPSARVQAGRVRRICNHFGISMDDILDTRLGEGKMEFSIAVAIENVGRGLAPAVR